MVFGSLLQFFSPSNSPTAPTFTLTTPIRHQDHHHHHHHQQQQHSHLPPKVDPQELVPSRGEHQPARIRNRSRAPSQHNNQAKDDDGLLIIRLRDQTESDEGHGQDHHQLSHRFIHPQQIDPKLNTSSLSSVSSLSSSVSSSSSSSSSQSYRFYADHQQRHRLRSILSSLSSASTTTIPSTQPSRPRIPIDPTLQNIPPSLDRPAPKGIDHPHHSSSSLSHLINLLPHRQPSPQRNTKNSIDISEYHTKNSTKTSISDNNTKNSISNNNTKSSIIDHNTKNSIIDNNTKSSVSNNNTKSHVSNNNTKDNISDDNTKHSISNNTKKKGHNPSNPSCSQSKSSSILSRVLSNGLYSNKPTTTSSSSSSPPPPPRPSQNHNHHPTSDNQQTTADRHPTQSRKWLNPKPAPSFSPSPSRHNHQDHHRSLAISHMMKKSLTSSFMNLRSKNISNPKSKHPAQPHHPTSNQTPTMTRSMTTTATAMMIRWRIMNDPKKPEHPRSTQQNLSFPKKEPDEVFINPDHYHQPPPHPDHASMIAGGNGASTTEDDHQPHSITANRDSIFRTLEPNNSITSSTINHQLDRTQEREGEEEEEEEEEIINSIPTRDFNEHFFNKHRPMNDHNHQDGRSDVTNIITTTDSPPAPSAYHPHSHHHQHTDIRPQPASTQVHQSKKKIQRVDPKKIKPISRNHPTGSGRKRTV